MRMNKIVLMNQMKKKVNNSIVGEIAIAIIKI